MSPIHAAAAIADHDGMRGSEAFDVSISGGVAPREPGPLVILNADADERAGSAVHTWYVNGVVAGVNVPSITISGRRPGRYRVDLVTITDVESRCGVATAYVDIDEVG